MRPQLMNSEYHPSFSFYYTFTRQVLTFSKLISSMVSLNNGKSNSTEQVANSASLNVASNLVFSNRMSCFRLIRYAQIKFNLKLLHKLVILLMQSMIKYYSSINCSAKYNSKFSLKMNFFCTSIFFLHLTIHGTTVFKMLRYVKHKDYQQQLSLCYLIIIEHLLSCL